MTTFGFETARLRQLVAPVDVLDDLDDSAVAERFARAAWSVIAEPGDSTAGALVAELGAAESLSAVLRAATSASDSGSTTDQGRDSRSPSTATTESKADTSLQVAGGMDAGQFAAAMQRWQPRLRSGDVERAFETAARLGIHLLTPTLDASAEQHSAQNPWPQGADDLGVHAPLALWVRGDPSRLISDRASIALVGARAATGYGEHVAGEAAAGLAGLGFPIVSGAAYGIDGMAHRAAMAAGGTTFAYLAGGVDRFYPAGHDDLLRRIVNTGVVVSELPCGAAPTKWRFLQRNRLIAACSAATVVVEAGARSGSLNTAGHASLLGRPLGAVPGPVTSPASAGCHRLLREYDAVCVTNTGEMAELVVPGITKSTSNEKRDSAEETRVLDALSTRAPRTTMELAARSGLAVAAVLAALGSLQVDGRVREHHEGWLAVPMRH